jgi:hypothetical protein
VRLQGLVGCLEIDINVADPLCDLISAFHCAVGRSIRRRH